MKRKQRLMAILVVVLMLGSTVTCFTDTAGTTETTGFSCIDPAAIDGDNMMNIIQELTSPKYNGRLAGTKENEMVAQYIASYFKKLGLETPQGLDSYMQYYNQSVVEFTDNPMLKLLDKDGKPVRSFEYGRDFHLSALDRNATSIHCKGKMGFATSVDMLDNREAVEGRIVAISYDVKAAVGYEEASKRLRQAGAVAIIMEANATVNGNMIISPMNGSWQENDMLPAINIAMNPYFESIPYLREGGQFELNCEYTAKQVSVPNVIGVIPGSDPVLRDEYVIIGAHFDHIGSNGDDLYFPGALDNASGTAAMLEIARYIKENNIQPRKTILFTAFNGEEEHMPGSQYYVTHPLYPLDRAVMINLDMVGSAMTDIPYSITCTQTVSAGLQDSVYQEAQAAGIAAIKSSLTSSDHISFERAGIPAIMITNRDILNGYHNSGDTIADVSKARIIEAAKLVLCYMDKNAF